MKKVFFLGFLSFSIWNTSAQTYFVPGAQVQPAWVFPLWFEDGSGAKDTLYFCYDSLANDFYPNTDTLFGERIVQKDTSKFWAGLWAYDGENATIQSYVSNSPFAQIFINKGIYPLKIFWDDTMFYSSTLPYPELFPLPRARISIICSDAFGNCPSDIELSMTAVASTFPFPLVDSAIFNGLENFYVGNTLGEFTMELRPFDSPLEDAVVNLQTKNIAVYPTLTSNGIRIESNAPVSMEIFDLFGKKINSLHRNITTTSEFVDLSTLSNGYYLLLFKNQTTLQIIKILKL